MLVVKKVTADRAALLDPQSKAWESVPNNGFELIGTPIGSQPTPYTRTAWKDRPIGSVHHVDARICHDGSALYVRLEWEDPSENREIVDTTIFPDAAAVLFPIGRDAPINTMGNEREWVNAWHWRADSQIGRSVYAQGVGTTEPTDESVDVASTRIGQRWAVVLSRELNTPLSGEKSVALSTDISTRMGIAIWEGNHGERAGFKGFTENWTDVKLASA